MNEEFIQAIVLNEMDKARELFQNGATFPDDLTPSKMSSVYSRLLVSKSFDFIYWLIQNKRIETDVYEYDTFDYSIFTNIARYLPNDEESIVFLITFLEQLQNINSEVNDQTLLSLFFDEGSCLEFIVCLANEGCNLNYKNNDDENFGFQILRHPYHAPEKGFYYLYYLAQEGIDLNAPNANGETLIQHAVLYRQYQYIQILMQSDADLNKPDNLGRQTAFFICIATLRDPEMYDFLKQYSFPDFDIQTLYGETPFIGFINNISGNETDLQLLEKLIADGADLYQTITEYDGTLKSVLDLASEKNVEILKKIIETAHPDLNKQDNNGNTLLHTICKFRLNNYADRQDRAKDLYRKVKLLIENGADVSITNDKDETPMMLASTDNLKIKTVELLIKTNLK